MELLDPDLHSIDEVYAQLQVYKKRREREQQELDHKIKTRFNLDADLKRLRRGRGPVFIIYTRLGRNYRLPRNSDCDELRAMHFACAAQAHALV